MAIDAIPFETGALAAWKISKDASMHVAVWPTIANFEVTVVTARITPTMTPNREMIGKTTLVVRFKRSKSMYVVYPISTPKKYMRRAAEIK